MTEDKLAILNKLLTDKQTFINKSLQALQIGKNELAVRYFTLSTGTDLEILKVMKK